MQNAHVFGTFILLGILIGAPSTVDAKAKSQVKPVEILSDPAGTGKPTVYTVLDGTSQITFSHPFLGQYNRAEISTHTKTGKVFTRFLLSRKTNRYRPVLRLETPYETLLSTRANCNDELLSRMTPMLEQVSIALDAKSLIRQTRDELTKAGLFTASCLPPKKDPEHSDAILNATAEFLTLAVQDNGRFPKHLRCMEQYGFSTESGVIQGLVRQSLHAPKPAPPFHIDCQKDQDGNEGSYVEKERKLSISELAAPDEGDYGQIIAHELGHAAGIRNHATLQLVNDCCSIGESCPKLAELNRDKIKGSKGIASVEGTFPEATVAIGSITAMAGQDLEAIGVERSAESLTKVALSEPTTTCTDEGTQACRTTLIAANQFAYSLIDPKGSCAEEHLSGADSTEPKCRKPIRPPPDNLFRIAKELGKPASEVTNADLKNAPMNPPIDWAPATKEETTAAMRALPGEDVAPKPPTRAIASVADLPMPSESRALGSAAGRRDVAATSRAAYIANAVASAATKVTDALTPATIDKHLVNRDDLYAGKYKPTREDPNYVVAGFKNRPLTVAEIGKMDLGFKNPFGGDESKSGSKTDARLAQRDSSDLPASAFGSGDAKAKAKGSDTPTAQHSVSGTAPAGPAAVARTSAAGEKEHGEDPGQAARGSSSSSSGRTPTNAVDYRSMGRSEMVMLLTSEYDGYEGDVNTSDFREALNRNNLRIRIKDGRVLGSGQEFYVYDPALKRMKKSDEQRAGQKP